MRCSSRRPTASSSRSTCCWCSLVAGFVALYIVLRIVRRAMRPARRGARRAAPHAAGARARRSTTPPSSRCSKAATAARASSPTRRWRYRSRRGLRRWSARVPRSRRATSTRAEALLARADAQVAEPRGAAADARGRDRSSSRGSRGEALAVLQALRKEAGLHTAALRLELRALQAAGRYAEIPPLVDQLVKRKVYGALEGELVRAARARGGARRAAGTMPRACARTGTGSPMRSSGCPRIARAAARQLSRARRRPRGRRDRSRSSLERHWESELVALYARVPAGRRDAAARAGRALARGAQSGRDAAARARRAVRARAAVGQGADVPRGEPRARRPSRRAHLALGELFARLGRDDDANAHLAAALKLAVCRPQGRRRLNRCRDGPGRFGRPLPRRGVAAPGLASGRLLGRGAVGEAVGEELVGRQRRAGP